MAWLSGKRAQPGVGTPAAEDSAQRITTIAAGFRKVFSIVNGKGNKTTKTQRAQRNHNIFVSLRFYFHNTYIEPALGVLYCRIAQSFSCLTSRTSGLPFNVQLF